VEALNEALHEIGIDVPLPTWVHPSRPVGVVTLEFLPNGGARAKLYFGGHTPQEAGKDGPDALRTLCATMAEACPLPGYYYATVRLYPGQSSGVAINKIYSGAKMDYGTHTESTLDALRDVARLFRAAGQLPRLTALLHRLRALRVHIIPTATALELGGRSADAYFGAFSSEVA
jgi:hypothetical protein